ncbi:MAG TPA: efflux RND transporter periplasmic adaptor subunit [Planctomycetota bacterium]|nr:efflux RND transporter periplasmic adaptor subunit [Planctomycetota bacterium]
MSTTLLRANGRAALLGALLATLPGCGDAGAGAKQRGVGQAKPEVVHLHLVTTAPHDRTVQVTGTLSAQEELVLGMQVAGRLQTLAVDVGDHVDAGAEIAALDRRDFELECKLATATLATARARLGGDDAVDLAKFDIEATAPVREAQAVLQAAQVQRDRLVELVQENLRPPSELETADAALGVAKSRLQRSRDDVRTWYAEVLQRGIEVEQADKRLADSRLVAPWSGRIAARHATAGQFLAAGAPVVTLLRVDPLRLQLRVPERASAGVALGQRVEFTVDGREGETRSGRIVRAAAGVDRSDRTRSVEAAIANPDGSLLPGGFCRARIVTAEAEPVLVVPKTAVSTFAGIDRVFTVEPGEPARARSRVVQVGRDFGDAWEVLQGVQAGDRVVLAAGGLVHDAAVVVVD